MAWLNYVIGVRPSVCIISPMKVKKDAIGLHVAAGGYKTRPINHNTRFKEGDTVVTHHFGGTIYAGVGKDATCNRHGKYLETWVTTGLRANAPCTNVDDERGQYLWYLTQALPGAHFSRVLTVEERKIGDDWFRQRLAQTRGVTTR